MNSDHYWWMILLCGLGTFVIRLWPMRWQQQQGDRGMPAWLRGALQALGPAAIGSLLIVSLLPSLLSGEIFTPLLRIIMGIAAIIMARKWIGGVAVPTLVGVLVYGLIAYLTR